eukprot:jgi/Bigna1/135260/aug1.28_g9968
MDGNYKTRGMLALILAIVTNVNGGMPPLKPTEIVEFKTKPDDLAPPPLTELPEIIADVRVAANASERASVGVGLTTDPEIFPSEPPEAPPTSDVPPVSPAGRWLHTIVWMGEAIYMYGGVASYDRSLDNDMWVYDAGAQNWHELQGSFVPPFGNGRPNPNISIPVRPMGVPAEPPLRDLPKSGNGEVSFSISVISSCFD